MKKSIALLAVCLLVNSTSYSMMPRSLQPFKKSCSLVVRPITYKLEISKALGKHLEKEVTEFETIIQALASDPYSHKELDLKTGLKKAEDALNNIYTVLTAANELLEIRPTKTSRDQNSYKQQSNDSDTAILARIILGDLKLLKEKIDFMNVESARKSDLDQFLKQLNERE